jgi:hypothetical protein
MSLLLLFPSFLFSERELERERGKKKGMVSWYLQETFVEKKDDIDI